MKMIQKYKTKNILLNEVYFACRQNIQLTGMQGEEESVEGRDESIEVVEKTSQSCQNLEHYRSVVFVLGGISTETAEWTDSRDTHNANDYSITLRSCNRGEKHKLLHFLQLDFLVGSLSTCLNAKCQ